MKRRKKQSFKIMGCGKKKRIGHLCPSTHNRNDARRRLLI
jgi:hypothetical protein